MQLGMVGLGRMGGNIVRRLLRAGHHCVAYDRDPAPGAALAAEGAQSVADLPAMAAALDAPRAIWLMLPAGAPTEEALLTLLGLLSPGDVVIDGGNSMWKDSVRRGAMLRAKGLHFLDIGTSGGVWGLARGYSLMIGGEDAVVRRLDPIFAALAPGKDAAPPTPGRTGDPRPEQGYVHAGPNGAGHFTKMIHNGIEYGMMQAFAEGLDILHHADSPALPEDQRLTLNLPDITEAWRRGSVVASWLLDLTAQALAAGPQAGKLLRPCLGQRRGALDGAGGGGDGGLGAGALGRAVRPLRQPGRGPVQRQGALGPAQGLRRASGTAQGMSRLVLVMGVSGAGKSTVGTLLAARLGVPFADADAFHPPANVAKMASGQPLEDADRWPWLDAIGAWLDAQAARDEGGVVTCSALKRAYRARLLGARPAVRLLYLEGDATLIGARQAARPNHFMPASLMASQFATLEPPAPEERAIILPVAPPPEAIVAAALAALAAV